MLIHRIETLRGNCSPEIEVSKDLGDDLTTQYKRMIGILRLLVEVRRIDLDTEVSILLSFRVSPCEEHVETPHWIFMYGGKSV